MPWREHERNSLVLNSAADHVAQHVKLAATLHVEDVGVRARSVWCVWKMLHSASKLPAILHVKDVFMRVRHEVCVWESAMETRS